MTSSPIWLSYSAYSQYNQCPKQYDYQRVSKTEPPTPESHHNMIVGSVTQSVFEDFYNDELWDRDENIIDLLYGRAEHHFEEFMDEEYVDFNDITCRFESRSEPLKEVYDIILKTVQGIKREKLIGPRAVSEKEMKVQFGDDFLYGYIDFIIRNTEGEVLLLDGKSSRHREEYVDKDQLYFYTLMYYNKYQELPDRLGFFYFRYADDDEEAFDWIDIDKYELMRLKQNIQDVLEGIKSKDFPANPEPSYCQWCQWEEMCDERQEQKKQNRAKRQLRRSDDKDEIDVDASDEDGMIGFDSLG